MDYREKNKWFITASKLKLFLDSPLLYKAVYVDEVPLDDIKKSPALEIGTMVDKALLTPVEFDEEYAFPVAGLKADLIAYCQKYNIPLAGNEKVDDLKALIYGDKKVLTEAQSLVVNGILSEMARQPLWSWHPDGPDYWSQTELEWTFGKLKIKWTLDRLYLNGDTAIIRDLKTTSQMYYNAYANNTQFFNDLQTKDTFHYKLQMAMYVWLIRQNYPDVKHVRVIIDAIGTTDPFFYQAIELEVAELDMVWDTTVVTLLEDIEKFENGELPWTAIEVESRAKLSGNWYYKLGTDDCIQKDFDMLTTPSISPIPRPDEIPEEFDWDSL